MTIQGISEYRLQSVKEEFGIGLLAKALKAPRKQLDKMQEILKVAGIGEKTDILA